MEKIIMMLLAVVLSLSASTQVDILWQQPITFGMPGMLDGLILSIDSHGNPYLGGDWNSGYNSHGTLITSYLVMKYRPDGSLAWFERNGTQTETDLAEGFRLDNNDNALITGNDDKGVTTLKYAPDGSVLWAQHYTQGYDVTPVDLETDMHGNSFVPCWYQKQNGADIQVLTIKYGADGTLLWNQLYHSAAPNTHPLLARTDAKGNVFVLASAVDPITIYDIVVLKYSPGGDLLWSWIYDDPLHGWDDPIDLEVDAQGNVYVTGDSDQGLNPLGPGIAALVTWKFDNEGHPLWKSVYGDTMMVAVPLAMALDRAAGEAYILGYSRTNQGISTFLLLKYNADGTQAWVKPVSLPQADQQDSYKVYFAPDGFLYVASYVADLTADGKAYTYLQTRLNKFDAQGQEHWAYGFAKQYAAQGLFAHLYTRLLFSGTALYLAGQTELVRAQIQAVRSEGDVSGPDGQADGIVDDWDITALILAFGSTEVQFDVNGDGKVDDTDLAIALKNFGTGVGE